MKDQLGGAFWYVVIAVPLAVVLFVVQIVVRVRAGARKAKRFTVALRGGKLVTAAAAPSTGDLAAALACGAHLAVNHGMPWNALTNKTYGTTELRTDLARDWGIRSSDEWHSVIESLLTSRGNDPAADFALAIRADIVGRTGRAPARLTWRDALVDAGRSGRLAETVITEALSAVDRIVRYEDRFRSDGLLPADGVVSSLHGYDWGRAVNVARWGLGAGYCDEAAARDAVLRAGALCFAGYESWLDFSAGYCLGRAWRFDDDEIGVWYDTVLEPHRILAGDPASPWRTVPWPASRPAHR